MLLAEAKVCLIASGGDKRWARQAKGNKNKIQKTIIVNKKQLKKLFFC